MEHKKPIIGIIGLGYVGLPLGVAFSKKFQIIGFDINEKRIKELKKGLDNTKEVSNKELFNSKRLKFTKDEGDLKICDVIIITVPTPVTSLKAPDLNPLKKASIIAGRNIKKGNTVVYESTVYPGATEEYCVPIIEKVSGFKLNRDFYVGYSPERINPGDKTHRITDIVKVTSGSNKKAAKYIDSLYSQIITAGTFKAKSIKVAEAAKVIENTQRDVNISLINELAIIFRKMDINTSDVLSAANTKWNFLDFKPGLVGGHCIGVDPYYLTYKSKKIGYKPKVILAGREINDNMSAFIIENIKKSFKEKSINFSKSKILILGLTFKENCPDIRNTKVIEIYNQLKKLKCNVDVFDPVCDRKEVKDVFGITLKNSLKTKPYDCIIAAVPHKAFKKFSYSHIRSLLSKQGFVYDLKNFFKGKAEQNL
tara:strand:+ start:6036 stop:7307 length:1272 start_codon:yes stop_codon:yes gene_type:complete